MTVLRSIVSDLVDRRLWPVAAVLVAALVAIPVLLIKPASHASAPTKDVAAAPAPALGTAAVSLANPAGGPVVGRLKDPFHQQHLPKASTLATGGGSSLGPATPGGGASAGTGTEAAGGGATGGGTTTNTSGSHSSAPRATLEVRFGLAQGSRARHEVSAGSPLPSPTNPLLVYLGRSKDGKAAFLVSSDAQPQGDGQCKPDKSICSTLYMKEGGTEFFDVTGPAGTVQYELEVLHIKG
jgi:hypothetical protein